MKLSVIGTGYVGLVQGAVFAEMGHDVICVDSLEQKIKSIEDFCKTGIGDLPVHEPGLPYVVKTNYDNGRLSFTTNLRQVVEESTAIFVCVGTPRLADGNTDLGAVYTVAEQIGKAMNYNNASKKFIVLKSTVPVNTHRKVYEIIIKENKNNFSVISNPEFMAQGRAVEDCRCPSRIVIGTDDNLAKKVMLDIYHPIIKKRNAPVECMDNVSAELCKYFSNAYLALQVDATNRFAELTREVGGDWDKIKKAIKHDKRIGRFVHAGLGFGGSCFEKDVSALEHMMFDACLFEHAEWLQKVIDENTHQKTIMVERIRDYFGRDNLENITIAIWGLSFKPETNDVRGAASIPSIIKLIKLGAKIKAYDSAAIQNAKIELNKELGCRPEDKGIIFCNKKEEALEDSDALFITVEWPEFLSPDFDLIKKRLKQPVIFDGKDIYDLSKMMACGFDYFSIGRPELLCSAIPYERKK